MASAITGGVRGFQTLATTISVRDRTVVEPKIRRGTSGCRLGLWQFSKVPLSVSTGQRLSFGPQSSAHGRRQRPATE